MEEFEKYIKVQSESAANIVKYLSHLDTEMAISVLCSVIDCLCYEVYGLSKKEAKSFRHTIFETMDMMSEIMEE